MREAEIKFGVHGSFALPEATELGVASLDPQPDQTLRSVYYDTPDLRLIRSGITLRHRTGEEKGDLWTLKLPIIDSEGPGLVRNEIDLPGVGRRVPDEARRLLTATLRTSELAPVATLKTRRRSWNALLEDGRLAAEIVDDEVSVIDARRVTARFREIEVEARELSLSELGSIRKELIAAGAVEVEPIPKLVRAIGPRATAPPELTELPDTGPGEAAGNTVQLALLRGARRLIDNDPLARLGNHEGVHQTRVAARRLRSDIKTFAPFLQDDGLDALRSGLKEVGASLGKVRDLDVFMFRLRRQAQDLARPLTPLFEAIEEELEIARGTMDQAMRNEDYARLIDDLVRLAEHPPLSDAAREPSKRALPAVVQRRWDELRKSARKLGRKSSEEEFHSVRITAKQTRYAAEAIAPALGAKRAKDATRFADRVSAIQDALGGHQDSILARDRLTAIASAQRAGASYNVALGRLIERQIQEAEKQRATFFEEWKRLDRDKNVEWLNS